DPFTDNVIPASRIDAVSANVRNFYRPPNTGGAAANFNNFIGTGSALNHQDQYTGRLDYHFARTQQIYGRVSWSDVQRGAVDFFGNGTNWVNPGGGGVPLVFNARNASLNYTNTITSTLMLELRYGFVRQFVFKTPALTGVDLKALGFPASFANAIF